MKITLDNSSTAIEYGAALQDIENSLLDLQDGSTWVVEANNLGWQNLEGKNIFYAETAEKFVTGVVGGNFDFRMVLDIPETIKTGYAPLKSQPVITAVIYTHDSPTGESRTIRPLLQHLANEFSQYHISKLKKAVNTYAKANGWEDFREVGKDSARDLTRTDIVWFIHEVIIQEWSDADYWLEKTDETIEYYAGK